MGVPVTASPYYIPEADGIVSQAGRTGRSDLTVFAKEEAAQKRILLAGCDPATGLLARMVELSGGRSLDLNVELVINNARVAAQVARSFFAG